ncbi:TolC family protein [Mariniflexile sp. AS56]|uniref:TolC family protein n=1 Tax=Mariniflexile sp. AS56 TaxID=3063957 RepID=UPI0026ECC38B|nr:TolC family protein [Mariniflexile sp. AS56]MDO7172904.1 TolC family protein [Mariniflexile sp. AS56]
MKNSLLVVVFLVSLSSFSQNKKWTLQECVDYALENNITVKQSELDTDIAEENITSAIGNFLPSVNGSTSGNFNFGSYIGQDGSRISSNTFGSSLSVNAGVTIFNGFRNTNLYKQAKLGLESSKVQLQKLKDDISLFVVNSYLNALLNKENYKIAEEQYKVTQQQVERITVLFNEGSQPKSALLDVEAQLASNKEQLINAQNSIDLALLNLAQLLQISHRGFDVEEVTFNLSSVELLYNDTDQIFNKALGDRPEIRAAEINIENSELDIEMAKSAFYPSVSLGAGLGTSYQHTLGEKDRRTIVDPNTGTISSIPNGFGTQFNNNLGYNVGVSISVPIFNGNRTRASVNRAIISSKRTAYGLEQAKQDLRSTIENAYLDARAALNQYQASNASLVAQEEAFRTAKESYSQGVTTSFEFEQVRNRLISAQSTLANSKYNFVFKSKLLEFYYGIPITLD